MHTRSANLGGGARAHKLLVRELRAAKHLAVADDGGVAAAEVLRELGVLVEEGSLAVHGQKVLRLHQLQHLLQLALLRVSAASCAGLIFFFMNLPLARHTQRHLAIWFAQLLVWPTS